MRGQPSRRRLHATHPPPRSHLPVKSTAWQDVKGVMVLAGAYEEAVKMMGEMTFLQVRCVQGGLCAGRGLLGRPPPAGRSPCLKPHARPLTCTPFLPPLRPQSLMTFPKEAINDETVELLQPYFAAPDFNYEAAKKASGNVAGLCNWAASMCKYHEVQAGGVPA